MIPKIRYLETQSIIMAQRKAVYDKIRSISKAHIIYPGITFGERLILDPKSVPGLAEAGWTPEMAQKYYLK